MADDDLDYVNALQGIFNSCDPTGSGLLCQSELVTLCIKLDLTDQSEALIQRLVGDDQEKSIDFDTFKEGFLVVLSENLESSDDDDSPGPDDRRSVSPKYVVGDKKYGRRSRPETDTDGEGGMSDVEYSRGASPGHTPLAHGELTLRLAALEDEMDDTNKPPATSPKTSSPKLRSPKTTSPKQGLRKGSTRDDRDMFEAQGDLLFDLKGQLEQPMASRDAESEAHHMRLIWKEVGVGKDGYLTLQELGAVCQRIGMDQMNKEELQHLFDKLDIDCDGRVSFDEFLQGLFQYGGPSTTPTHSRQVITPRQKLRMSLMAAQTDENRQTPSVISSGSGLFSALDTDNTGYVKADAIIELWDSFGIPQGAEILEYLQFNMYSKINLIELSYNLEQELHSLEEDNATYQAAIATYEYELRYVKSNLDHVTGERDKMKADLTEATNRISLLVKEGDERYTALEKSKDRDYSTMERRYQEQIRLLQGEIDHERESIQHQTSKQRQRLETEVELLKEEENKMKDMLSKTQKDFDKMETEILDMAEKCNDLERHNLRLQRELEGTAELRLQLDELESNRENLLDEQQKFSEQKLLQLQAENMDLKDKGDEMTMEIEDLRQQVSVHKKQKRGDRSAERHRSGSTLAEYAIIKGLDQDPGSIASDEASDVESPRTRQRRRLPQQPSDGDTEEERDSLHTAKLQDEVYQLRLEKETLQTRHQDNLTKSQTDHETEIQQLKAQHQDTLTKSQADHETEIQQLTKQRDHELKLVQEQHDEKLQSVQEQYDEKLKSVQEQHDEKLQSVQEQHDEKLKSVQEQHDEKLKSVMVEHQDKSNALETEHANKLKALTGDSDSQVQTLLEQHEIKDKQLQNEHQDKIESLHDDHAGELSAVKSENDTVVTKLKDENEDKLQSLKFDYEGQINLLHSTHEEDINDLKSDYNQQIQTIINEKEEEIKILEEKFENLSSEHDVKSEELQAVNRGFTIERKDIEDAFKMEIAEMEDKHMQQKNQLIKKMKQEQDDLETEHLAMMEENIHQKELELKEDFSREREDWLIKAESEKNLIREDFDREKQELLVKVESEKNLLKHDHKQDIERLTEQHLESLSKQEVELSRQQQDKTQMHVNNAEELHKQQLEADLVVLRDQLETKHEEEKSSMRQKFDEEKAGLLDRQRNEIYEYENMLAKGSDGLQGQLRTDFFKLLEEHKQEQQVALLDTFHKDLNDTKNKLQQDTELEKSNITMLLDVEKKNLENKLEEEKRHMRQEFDEERTDYMGDVTRDKEDLVRRLEQDKQSWAKDALQEKEKLIRDFDKKKDKLEKKFEKEKERLMADHQHELEMQRRSTELDQASQELEREILRKEIEEELEEEIQQKLENQFIHQTELLKSTFTEERDQLESQIRLLQQELQEAANQDISGAGLKNDETEQKLRLAKDAESRYKRQIEELNHMISNVRDEKNKLEDEKDNLRKDLEDKLHRMTIEKEDALSSSRLKALQSAKPMTGELDKADMLREFDAQKRLLEDKTNRLERQLESMERRNNEITPLQLSHDRLMEENSSLQRNLRQMEDKNGELVSQSLAAEQYKTEASYKETEKEALKQRLQLTVDQLTDTKTALSLASANHQREQQNLQQKLAAMVPKDKYNEQSTKLLGAQKKVGALEAMVEKQAAETTKVLMGTQSDHQRAVQRLEEEKDESDRRATQLKQILDGRVTDIQKQCEDTSKTSLLVKDLYVENAHLMKCLEVTEKREKDAQRNVYKLEEKCRGYKSLIHRLCPLAAS